MRNLELKEIVAYIPYKIMGYEASGHICWFNSKELATMDLSGYLPILRPLSNLYKTITHNGKEIVPIVELAKIAYCGMKWTLSENFAVSFNGRIEIRFMFIKEVNSFVINDNEDYFDGQTDDRYNFGRESSVFNQVQLFDYLNELKIDYRGLIDAGLAVSVYDLKVNPYK
jgi:hypothetical protein